MRPSNLFHRGLWLGLLVVTLTAGNLIAAEIVMRVEGVDGETCFTPDHDKWICVLATSWGVSSSCTARNPTLCPANIQDFSVTMLQTSATPPLLFKLLHGDHIPSVDVEWWEQLGTDRVKTAALRLENVFVTSLSTGAAGDRPVENVTFNFGKMTYTVWARTATGIGPPQTIKWNVVTGKIQ